MLVLPLCLGLSCMHGSVLVRLWEEGSLSLATMSDQAIVSPICSFSSLNEVIRDLSLFPHDKFCFKHHF